MKFIKLVDIITVQTELGCKNELTDGFKERSLFNLTDPFTATPSYPVTVWAIFWIITRGFLWFCCCTNKKKIIKLLLQIINNLSACLMREAAVHFASCGGHSVPAVDIYATAEQQKATRWTWATSAKTTHDFLSVCQCGDTLNIQYVAT